MPNKLRGYVPFVIGDEEYYLRLGFNQLAAADSQLETSSIQAAISGRFDAIQALLTVGLSNRRNPSNMGRILRDALDDGAVTLDYCLDRLIEALKASGVLSDAEGDEEHEGE